MGRGHPRDEQESDGSTAGACANLSCSFSWFWKAERRSCQGLLCGPWLQMFPPCCSTLPGWCSLPSQLESLLSSPLLPSLPSLPLPSSPLPFPPLSVPLREKGLRPRTALTDFWCFGQWSQGNVRWLFQPGDAEQWPQEVTHSSLDRGGDQASDSHSASQKPFSPGSCAEALEPETDCDLSQTLLETFSENCRLLLGLSLLFCKTDKMVPVLFLQSPETCSSSWIGLGSPWVSLFPSCASVTPSVCEAVGLEGL